jgi:hypothetical protein
MCTHQLTIAATTSSLSSPVPVPNNYLVPGHFLNLPFPQLALLLTQCLINLLFCELAVL